MEDYFEDSIDELQTLDFMRYIRAILRRWWLVGLVTLLISVPWILHLKKQPPIYESRALIGFENMGGGNQRDIVQSRITKMRSRSFAEEVTSELGLPLELQQDREHPILLRKDVFKKFSTTKEAVQGQYTLRFYPSGYCAFYHGFNLLDSLRIEEFVDDTVRYNNLIFSLNPEIVRDRSEIYFTIHSFRGTVSSLRSREKINPNREGDLISISLTDQDPYLATETVNMLADIFVEKNRTMRKQTNELVSNYLKEQLDMASTRLNESDYELKGFRNKHLKGLDRETQETVDQLNNVQNQINRLEVQRNELDLLLSKLDPTVSDFDEGVSMHYIYRRIAAQPIFEEDNAMAMTRQELNDLYDEENDLLERGIPERNPNVMEIREKIWSLQNTLTALGQKKIQVLDNSILDLKNQAESMQQNLSNLPEEELQFIKLSRRRNTNEDIYKIYLRRFMEAQISEAVASENIYVIDPAIVPYAPIEKDKKKKAILGMILGLSLGLSAALFWELIDKSIKTRDDIKRYLKLPILGSIPKVKFDEYELQDSEKAKSISSQIVTHDYSPTPVGEAYRSLRTNILFSKNFGPLRSLVISSIAPGEGKSFTAANLAIALAQQKSKTLLIDADLRRGVLHNSFNCPKKSGLTNYLTGVMPLESVLNETFIPNLNLISCGSMIPNPSEILGSNKMKKFIEGITERFDFVLFDTPPLLAASDAVILGTLVDGVTVVVRAGKTNREEVQRKLELFHNVHAKIIGVVLNGAGVEVAHEGYSYYNY